MTDATGGLWSDKALKLCLACDFAWTVAVFAGCSYVVFWMGHSGWWFLLAMLLSAAWNCKPYRSPAQIAADPPEDD